MSANAAAAAPPGFLQHWASYPVLGALILGADYLTGPFLQFPILFVLPVALAAWYRNERWAYILAVVLPLGRLIIALYVDVPAPPLFSLANAAIRIIVLVLLAWLVARTARQTRELEERVSELVRVCAWSRTVEYKGEWLSFEDYLKRRFKMDSTHGISPAEMENLTRRVGEAMERNKAGGGSGRN